MRIKSWLCDGLAIERILNALIGNLLQHLLLFVREREALVLTSQNGKSMIAHHTTMIVVINIARVLIQQMFHLVMMVHHQHQRHNGQFTTSTRCQIADTTIGILIDGGDKRLHIATLKGLARLGIHLAGILVRWIMRKVATHNEEVLVCEIWLQHLSHPFQFSEVVGRYNNRYDRRHLLKPSLQERQLHLQTMLPVVGLRAISETIVSSNQLLGSLTIHLQFSQRCGVIIRLTIHRSPIQPLVMTGPQEEDAL